jgi:large subunit ribosomal protein L9
MKVLFVKEVAGVAAAGEIKEVKPGFARNYLLPQGIGVLANDKTMEQVRMREEAIRRRAEKELADARETASTIKRLTVTVYAKAGEAGRLHGSVTSSDIAQQLKREAGLDIDKRKITVEPAIKTLGPHEVKVDIHHDISETLKIVVAAQ